MHIKHIGKSQLGFMILPLFIIFTYGCLFLETIKYPGLIAKYLYIDVKVYFTITIVLLIFLNTKSKAMSILLKFNQIFMVLVFAAYLCFWLIEGANFRNYVLNTFHFHLDGLVLVILFSFFIFMANKFKDSLPKVNGRKGILYIAILLSLTYFVVDNLANDFDLAFRGNSYILFHLQNSYDDRMSYEWGENYNFMVFVKNNTPEDATIVIPPMQNPWLMGTGNDHFVRAFLFPRKIVQESLVISDVSKFDSNTYILISWGREECKPDGCHGWPRQRIEAKNIIFKDPNSVNVVETKVDSAYNPEDKRYVYGVIEL